MNAYYLFRKTPVPKDIPPELADEVIKLKRIHSKDEYLRAAYNLVSSRYISGRVDTILRVFELFSTSLSGVWNRKGFMHCTNQNYLLCILLVKGGLFTESDIKPRWTLIGFYSPHQYLKVRLSDDKWIDVDCWGRHYGVSYGNHAWGFNSTMRRSFVE